MGGEGGLLASDDEGNYRNRDRGDAIANTSGTVVRKLNPTVGRMVTFNDRFIP
jgi:hypothetical protein